MSTLNFWDCEDNLPLMVMSDEEVAKSFWDYEEENREIDPIDIQVAYDELFDFCECIDSNGRYTTFNNALEELNETLLWYKAELKSGYYNGVQIYVSTNWIGLGEWDDEEVEDEFGYEEITTVAELKERIDFERKLILDFMKASENLGFRELLHLGTFLNGEGVYRYRDTIC